MSIQENIGSGLESTVGRYGNIVIKRSKRSFANEEDADKYASDAVAYENALKQQGFSLPYTHSIEIVDRQDGGFGVQQTVDYVDGQDLAAHTKNHGYDKLRGILEHVMDADRAANGHLTVPIDGKPDNFIVDKHGKVHLIDILPPLMRQDGSFPYEYMSAGQHWVDSYMRDAGGVAVRLFARTINESEGKKSLLNFAVHPERLDAKGKSELTHALRRKMVPFLATTTARRLKGESYQ